MLRRLRLLACHTRAGAANQAFAQPDSNTLTPLASTTLGFSTEDRAPCDDAGAIAPNITPGTAPATFALMGAGLGGIGTFARKRGAGNPRGCPVATSAVRHRPSRSSLRAGR